MRRGAHLLVAAITFAAGGCEDTCTVDEAAQILVSDPPMEDCGQMFRATDEQRAASVACAAAANAAQRPFRVTVGESTGEGTSFSTFAGVRIHDAWSTYVLTEGSEHALRYRCTGFSPQPDCIPSSESACLHCDGLTSDFENACSEP